MSEPFDTCHVVTGAASGMGRATVRLLVERGIPVVAVDVSASGLGDLTDGTVRAMTTRAVDISDRDQVHELFAGLASDGVRVSAVLHFAGIFDSTPLEDLTPAGLDRVLSVNLAGSLWMCQAAIEHMTPRGGGAIVLTASDSARAGSTVSGPAYAASKGAVIAMTRTLAVVAGRHGVRVNAVCPGLTDTGMSDTWSKSVVHGYVARTPLGRLADPVDIASAAVCLAGGDMGFVTGEILEVNGGTFFD